jgi:predicted nucleic acid-binding protein
LQTLVDSSVWIDYFQGVPTPQTDSLDRLIGRAPLVVSDVTVAEVLQGIPDEMHRKQAEEALLKFWLVEIGGLPLHRKSALRYQTLRARGVPVQTTECLIATFCIENGFSLLHSSPGFEPFERHFGLRVAHPSAS